MILRYDASFIRKGIDMRNLLIGAVLALLLSACAGTPFKWDAARQVKNGMTMQEVKRIMGEPYQVSSRDGVIRYVWVEVNAITFASKSLTVDFKDGIVVRAPQVPDEFK